jgi:ABC-type multidrug transport system fused ATPase/permease subunit
MIKGSVAQNIAFGIAEQEIDWVRCQLAASFACIADVIEQLPAGFDSVLGEGASLSGGEVQRLAIARAMYFSPDILVLDEPLSALDPLVSERLVDNLCSKKFAKTVIMVTHDWEILPRFDKIIVVDQGRVVVADEYAVSQRFIAELREKIPPPETTKGDPHV